MLRTAQLGEYWPLATIYQNQQLPLNFKLTHIDLPGTQMSLVLNGKCLLLEGSNPKIEDKQVPGLRIEIL